MIAYLILKQKKYSSIISLFFLLAEASTFLKTEADSEMTEYVSDEKAYNTEEEDPIETYESTSQGEGKYNSFCY